LESAKDLNTRLSSSALVLKTSAGFVRVGIALPNPMDRDALVGRHVIGMTPVEPYLASLTGALPTASVPVGGAQRARASLGERFHPGHHLRPSAGFLDTWKATSAVLAPLRIIARPIGIIYADMPIGLRRG
jgi:hypothetical protein